MYQHYEIFNRINVSCQGLIPFFFLLGLWQALQGDNPDRKQVETLLKNWCRVTTVKNGQVTSMKFLVKDDIHKVDLLQLLEKYENTNELALATTAGMGFIVRMWVKQGEVFLLYLYVHLISGCLHSYVIISSTARSA